MRTTLAIKGATELILEKAVEIGLANSKTDALRIGALCMNKEYKLVKDFEMELVARKINKEKEEMARKGQKYLTEKEALAKYAKKR